MRVVPILIVLLLLTAGARDANAQVSGYAVAGFAGFSGFFGSSMEGGHAGAGIEVLAGGRVGASGEFGLLGIAGGSALWVSSLNGVVHLVPNRRGSGTSPFISGGYTRLSSGEGAFNAWNAGVGLDIWPSERVGIRIDLRDHVRPDSRGAVHYWSMRAGVTIR